MTKPTLLDVICLMLGYWMDEYAAFREAQETATWQSIETAPKDGTTVLLSSPGGNGFGPWIRTAYWARQIESWTVDMVGRPVSLPTLWAPLPAPPAPREMP